MSDTTPRPPAQSSRDFLQWGKGFLKDALHRANAAERSTRPLDGTPFEPKKTTRLDGELQAVLATPRVTATELAQLGVMLADNAQQPLYPAIGPEGEALDAEAERRVVERAIASLREVGDRLAAVPDLVPRGQYAGMTLAQVIEGVSAKDLRAFFYFIRTNPRYFAGKTWRFAEVFVAWVIDHGDAEASAP